VDKLEELSREYQALLERRNALDMMNTMIEYDDRVKLQIDVNRTDVQLGIAKNRLEAEKKRLIAESAN